MFVVVCGYGRIDTQFSLVEMSSKGWGGNQLWLERQAVIVEEVSG